MLSPSQLISIPPPRLTECHHPTRRCQSSTVTSRRYSAAEGGGSFIDKRNLMPTLGIDGGGGADSAAGSGFASSGAVAVTGVLGSVWMPPFSALLRMTAE